MRARIQGRYLVFTEFTDKEIKWVQDFLTWDTTEYGLAWELYDNVKISRDSKTMKQKCGKLVAIVPNEKKPDSKLESHCTVELFNNGKTVVVPGKHLSKVNFESLLMVNSDGNPFTFYGALKLMKPELPFDIEIENEDVKVFKRHTVPVDILPSNPMEGFEKLDDFQAFAAGKAVSLYDGLEVVPTGGGKTEIMCATTKYMQQELLFSQGLVVVPTTALVGQWIDRAKRRGLPEASMGVLTDKRKDWDAQLIVTTMAMVGQHMRGKSPEMFELLKKLDLLIFDEAQYIRSDTSQALIAEVQHCPRILGFSGSPFTQDNVMSNYSDAFVFSVTGGVIFETTYAYLKSIGRIAEAVVHMKKTSGNMLKFRSGFNRIYDSFIWKNESRNKMIVDYTNRFVRNNFQTLILVQRKEHAEKLMKLLKHLNPISIFGSSKGMQYDEYGNLEDTPIDYDQFRKLFGEKKWMVCIASQVLDMGFDLPTIGAAIIAGAGKARIGNLQRIGRSIRSKKFINRVYILDFYDRGHIYLASHSKQRRALYEEAECLMVDDEYLFNNMFVTHAKQLAAYNGS